MTFYRRLPNRLFQPLKALLVLSLFVFLSGCRQEAAPTPAAITSAASPSANTVTPEALSEPTAVPPTAVPPTVAAAEPVADDEPPAEPVAGVEADSPTAPGRAGALIQVSLESQVGVLLDGLPAAIRDEIAGEISQRPDEYWLELARKQVRLTRNRLNFRNFVYAGKGQLPLPPEDVWTITLDPSGPSRQIIEGHDLLMIDYAFDTTLLSDSESPARAEPALAQVGGIWDEPFVFPADPQLLLQRTGNACINEGGFPPHSFDSENVWVFYDHACTADSGGAAGCHRTRLPRLSCREALQERVGEVESLMRFERLAWDSALADAVRVEAITGEEAPDLKVVGEDLDTNRIAYRYIEPEDCALLEDAVGASGWRRLLQFSATVANIGARALDIGPVVAEDPVNHVYTYNSCHDHFHYSNYGDFSLGAAGQTENSKQAFCVQSTSRYSNNEAAPLIHDYSCSVQGIQAGWVDEYVAGLDTQWIDITDMELPAEGTLAELTFVSNGEQFLCEGTPVVDENGEPVWEPSGFTTAAGESINRRACDFIPEWDANNRSTRSVFIPQKGGFVTAPCPNGEFSPLRNCGFTELLEEDRSCVPGETVVETFRLQQPSGLGVVRVCETSARLGGLACTFEESQANVVVDENPTVVSFPCPPIRDAAGVEGGYTLLTAPVWPLDAAQAVLPVETSQN